MTSETERGMDRGYRGARYLCNQENRYCRTTVVRSYGKEEGNLWRMLKF